MNKYHLETVGVENSHQFLETFVLRTKKNILVRQNVYFTTNKFSKARRGVTYSN